MSTVHEVRRRGSTTPPARPPPPGCAPRRQHSESPSFDRESSSSSRPSSASSSRSSHAVVQQASQREQHGQRIRRSETERRRPSNAQSRGRRRPEITIVSAQPMSHHPAFADGDKGGYIPPEAPPSYEQAMRTPIPLNATFTNPNVPDHISEVRRVFPTVEQISQQTIGESPGYGTPTVTSQPIHHPPTVTSSSTIVTSSVAPQRTNDTSTVTRQSGSPVPTPRRRNINHSNNTRDTRDPQDVTPANQTFSENSERTNRGQRSRQRASNTELSSSRSSKTSTPSSVNQHHHHRGTTGVTSSSSVTSQSNTRPPKPSPPHKKPQLKSKSKQTNHNPGNVQRISENRNNNSGRTGPNQSVSNSVTGDAARVQNPAEPQRENPDPAQILRNSSAMATSEEANDVLSMFDGHPTNLPAPLFPSGSQGGATANIEAPPNLPVLILPSTCVAPGGAVANTESSLLSPGGAVSNIGAPPLLPAPILPNVNLSQGGTVARMGGPPSFSAPILPNSHVAPGGAVVNTGAPPLLPAPFLPSASAPQGGAVVGIGVPSSSPAPILPHTNVPQGGVAQMSATNLRAAFSSEVITDNRSSQELQAPLIPHSSVPQGGAPSILSSLSPSVPNGGSMNPRLGTTPSPTQMAGSSPLGGNVKHSGDGVLTPNRTGPSMTMGLSLEPNQGFPQGGSINSLPAPIVPMKRVDVPPTSRHKMSPTHNFQQCVNSPTTLGTPNRPPRPALVPTQGISNNPVGVFGMTPVIPTSPTKPQQNGLNPPLTPTATSNAKSRKLPPPPRPSTGPKRKTNMTTSPNNPQISSPNPMSTGLNEEDGYASVNFQTIPQGGLLTPTSLNGASTGSSPAMKPLIPEKSPQTLVSSQTNQHILNPTTNGGAMFSEVASPQIIGETQNFADMSMGTSPGMLQTMQPTPVPRKNSKTNEQETVNSDRQIETVELEPLYAAVTKKRDTNVQPAVNVRVDKSQVHVAHSNSVKTAESSLDSLERSRQQNIMDELADMMMLPPPLPASRPPIEDFEDLLTPTEMTQALKERDGDDNEHSSIGDVDDLLGMSSAVQNTPSDSSPGGSRESPYEIADFPEKLPHVQQSSRPPVLPAPRTKKNLKRAESVDSGVMGTSPPPLPQNHPSGAMESSVVYSPPEAHAILRKKEEKDTKMKKLRRKSMRFKETTMKMFKTQKGDEGKVPGGKSPMKKVPDGKTFGESNSLGQVQNSNPEPKLSKPQRPAAPPSRPPSLPTKSINSQPLSCTPSPVIDQLISPTALSPTQAPRVKPAKPPPPKIAPSRQAPPRPQARKNSNQNNHAVKSLSSEHKKEQAREIVSKSVKKAQDKEENRNLMDLDLLSHDSPIQPPSNPMPKPRSSSKNVPDLDTVPVKPQNPSIVKSRPPARAAPPRPKGQPSRPPLAIPNQKKSLPPPSGTTLSSPPKPKRVGNPPPLPLEMNKGKLAVATSIPGNSKGEQMKPNKVMQPFEKENTHISTAKLQHKGQMSEVKGLYEAIALYEFQGAMADDLGFKVGDRITVIEEVDSEWLRGQVADKVGIFPKAYVQQKMTSGTSDSTQKPQNTEFGQNSLGKDSSSANGAKNVQEAPSTPDSGWDQEPDGSSNSSASYVMASEEFPGKDSNLIEDAPSTNQQAVTTPTAMVRRSSTALFAFTGQDDSELTFNEGDEIRVTGNVNEDWFIGEINGKSGIFPAAYVDVTSTNEDSSPPAFPEPTTDSMSPSGGGFVEPMATAIRDYTAPSSDEISFQVNDVLYLLEAVGSDWLLAQHDKTGSVGKVLLSHVKIVHPLPEGGNKMSWIM